MNTRPRGLGISIRWSNALWLPLVIASLLLFLPQASFIWTSLQPRVGLAGGATLANYAAVIVDEFYLRWTWVTVYLSAGAALVGMLIAFPSAYLLVSLPSRAASVLVVLLLISSFVTVVIRVLGLTLFIGPEGLFNAALRWSGVIDEPLRLTNNQLGVLIGLLQYTLSLQIILQYGTLQSISNSLQEASLVHGAGFLSMIRRVLLPLAWPGVVASGLIAFNLNMGAFTSAALLGGGKVLTLPILIQRRIIQNVDYTTGATLSTLLLILVLAINVVAALMLRKPRWVNAAMVQT